MKTVINFLILLTAWSVVAAQNNNKTAATSDLSLMSIADTWNVDSYKPNSDDFATLVSSPTQTFTYNGDYFFSSGLLIGYGIRSLPQRISAPKPNPKQYQMVPPPFKTQKRLRETKMCYNKYETCIASCTNCAIECKMCLNACLQEKDIKMLVRCIKLNNDCNAICLLAMDAMASDSEHAKQICSLCADICNACAIECDKHSHMDHCKKCAEACRKCATECSKMSKI